MSEFRKKLTPAAEEMKRLAVHQCAPYSFESFWAGAAAALDQLADECAVIGVPYKQRVVAGEEAEPFGVSVARALRERARDVSAG